MIKLGVEKEKGKLGCHDFLNSKLLSYPLTRMGDSNPFHLVFDTPARLSSMLQKGEVDLAVIPSIEYGRQCGLRIIPGFSISSFGAVETVLLFCKENVSKIEKVAVDSTSRTSVAMLRILLAERFKIRPSFISATPSIDQMMEIADAALVIGDNAFTPPSSKYSVYDLGGEWYTLSKKPFVHAVLAVSPDTRLSSLETSTLGEIFLSLSRNENNLANVVDEEAKRLGIDKDVVKEYLTKRIRYTLGEPEIDGLKHFFALSKKYGLLKSTPEIVFYDQ
ncbi:MAG: menaquinone biosynthetic enzyme MqnA/MqnD family protein [Nitrospinota bacterium]